MFLAQVDLFVYDRFYPAIQAAYRHTPISGEACWLFSIAYIRHWHTQRDLKRKITVRRVLGTHCSVVSKSLWQLAHPRCNAELIQIGLTLTLSQSRVWRDITIRLKCSCRIPCISVYGECSHRNSTSRKCTRNNYTPTGIFTEIENKTKRSKQ